MSFISLAGVNVCSISAGPGSDGSSDSDSDSDSLRSLEDEQSGGLISPPVAALDDMPRDLQLLVGAHLQLKTSTGVYRDDSGVTLGPSLVSALNSVWVEFPAMFGDLAAHYLQSHALHLASRGPGETRRSHALVVDDTVWLPHDQEWDTIRCVARLAAVGVIEQTDVRLMKVVRDELSATLAELASVCKEICQLDNPTAPKWIHAVLVSTSPLDQDDAGRLAEAAASMAVAVSLQYTIASTQADSVEVSVVSNDAFQSLSKPRGSWREVVQQLAEGNASTVTAPPYVLRSSQDCSAFAHACSFGTGHANASEMYAIDDGDRGPRLVPGATVRLEVDLLSDADMLTIATGLPWIDALVDITMDQRVPDSADYITGAVGFAGLCKHLATTGALRTLGSVRVGNGALGGLLQIRDAVPQLVPGASEELGQHLRCGDYRLPARAPDAMQEGHDMSPSLDDAVFSHGFSVSFDQRYEHFDVPGAGDAETEAVKADDAFNERVEECVSLAREALGGLHELIYHDGRKYVSAIS